MYSSLKTVRKLTLSFLDGRSRIMIVRTIRAGHLREDKYMTQAVSCLENRK